MTTSGRNIIGAIGIALMSALLLAFCSDVSNKDNSRDLANRSAPLLWLQVSVLAKSQNMRCFAQKTNGSTYLIVIPPDEIDRQMAVTTPNGRWLLYSKKQFEVTSQSQRKFAIDPSTATLLEWHPIDEAGDELSPVPFFQGNGIYELIFSDNLEQDLDLIEYQAWCKFRIHAPAA